MPRHLPRHGVTPQPPRGRRRPVLGVVVAAIVAVGPVGCSGGVSRPEISGPPDFCAALRRIDAELGPLRALVGGAQRETVGFDVARRAVSEVESRSSDLEDALEVAVSEAPDPPTGSVLHQLAEDLGTLYVSAADGLRASTGARDFARRMDAVAAGLDPPADFGERLASAGAVMERTCGSRPGLLDAVGAGPATTAPGTSAPGTSGSGASGSGASGSGASGSGGSSPELPADTLPTRPTTTSGQGGGGGDGFCALMEDLGPAVAEVDAGRVALEKAETLEEFRSVLDSYEASVTDLSGRLREGALVAPDPGTSDGLVAYADGSDAYVRGLIAAADRVEAVGDIGSALAADRVGIPDQQALDQASQVVVAECGFALGE